MFRPATGPPIPCAANSGGGSQGQKGSALTAATVAAANGLSQSADCPKGGKVSVKMDLGGFGSGAPTTNGGFDMDARYEDCAIEFDNPSTEEVEKDELKLTGDVKMGMKFSFGEQSQSTTVTLKGNLKLGGVIDDTFDADVVQTFGFGTSADSASMRYTVDGYVKTSTESFEFENESFSFSADAAGGLKGSASQGFGGGGSFDTDLSGAGGAGGFGPPMND